MLIEQNKMNTLILTLFTQTRFHLVLTLGEGRYHGRLLTTNVVREPSTFLAALRWYMNQITSIMEAFQALVILVDTN